MNAPTHPVTLTLYAKDARRLAAFYQAALGLPCVDEAPGFMVLASGAVELIIVQAPDAIAQGIVIASPPVLRESTPIKLSFLVPDIAQVQRAIRGLGGGLKDASATWLWRGRQHLDGWDPEGNVFQLRQ
jgi:predicted enzyme related to lactoylglutathione lyase